MTRFLIVLCVVMCCMSAQGQNNALLHSNSYSSPNLAYGDLEYLEDDSVFVYQFFGANYEMYAVNYGLWSDAYIANTFETSGHKTVFLDRDWNELGVFESGTQVLSHQPIGWNSFRDDTGRAMIGRRISNPYFSGLPYNLLGGFTDLSYDKMLFEFNVTELSVLPLFFTDHYDYIYYQVPSYFERSLHLRNHGKSTMAKLNTSESIVIAPLMDEQLINESHLTSVNTNNLGYNWIKYNHDSYDYELVTVESENDLIAYHHLYPSHADDSYFGLKTLRGENLTIDTDGLPYENVLSDSTFTTVLTRENASGEAIWTSELYAYNNSFSDSSAGSSVGVLRFEGGLVEQGNRVFYSENLMFNLYDDDTLFVRDFFGNNSTFSSDSSSLICANSDFVYGKSFLYSLDGDSGNKLSLLEIEGFQFLFSGGAGCESNQMHHQEPHVFNVGDSLAWVHDFYSDYDTTVTFFSTLSGGTAIPYELNLQAGYSSVVLWLNTDLNVLDAWVIPASLGEEDYSRGIQISEIVSFGQDSILIAATIDYLVSTSMDPSGQAEIVNNGPEKTAFLGIYGTSFVDGLLDYPERSLNFNVFPNPSTDVLYVRFESDLILAEFSLFDLYGRSLKSGFVSSSTHSAFSISVSDIQSGTYFLRISSDNHSGVKKVIVK